MYYINLWKKQDCGRMIHKDDKSREVSNIRKYFI